MRHTARVGRGVLLAVATVVAPVAARAEAVPPATVAFALDTSGSVGPREFTRARDLALAILAALPPGSEVAVLAFDDQSRVVVPRTSRPDEVRARLAGLKVGGRYTALHDALYDASRYVRDAPGLRRAVVLITDGIDENSALNLEDGLRVATDAQIPVLAIGVGSRPQERVLRRIAKLTGGDYVTFAGARASEIAGRIAALPAKGSGEAATPGTEGPGRTTTVATSPAAAGISRPATAPAAAPGPVASASRLRGPAIAIAAVVVALAGIGLFLRSRREPQARLATCPTCGRHLPAGSATCPSCASDRARVSAPASSAPADLSETVLSRMNLTEEYLERTITLQERPVLAITRGPGTGQVYELSATTATSIGRSRANDIRVDDVSISGQHCRVRPEDGRFVLHDLKSTNGTLVNDRKVTRHVLEEGDVIQIGETSIQYRREMKRG